MLLNQDANLKSQIIFTKDIYNNDVVKWNKEIFKWPVNKIVAAKENYTNELFYSVKYQEPIKIKGPFI